MSTTATYKTATATAGGVIMSTMKMTAANAAPAKGSRREPPTTRENASFHMLCPLNHPTPIPAAGMGVLRPFRWFRYTPGKTDGAV